MQDIDLTLAVSTLAAQLDAALNVFSGLTASDNTEFLILVQGLGSYSEAVTIPTYIRVIHLDSIGLSRSRNAALQHARGTHIWFLDNDVTIRDEDVSWVIPRLKDTKSLYIGQIRCTDCDGLYKDYDRNRKGKLGALRISSIEIIAPRNSAGRNGISFNPAIGLGTDYPSGEENLFVLDAIRAGLGISFLGKPIVGHPCLLEERKPGQTWTRKPIVQSKGIIARQVGGIPSLALLAWWGLRATQYNRSLRGFIWLVSGYCMSPERGKRVS